MPSVAVASRHVTGCYQDVRDVLCKLPRRVWPETPWPCQALPPQHASSAEADPVLTRAPCRRDRSCDYSGGSSLREDGDAVASSHTRDDYEPIAELCEPCGCLRISPRGEICFLQAVVGVGRDADLNLDRLAWSTIETGSGGIEKVARQYFATVHRWLPIVDKSVCYDAIRRQRVDAGASPGPHFSLLFLCMALVSRSRCATFRHGPEESSLYLLTRRLFLTSQTLPPSLALLQAGLLIVSYECGHGLERSSYLTLASCVALARVLGYDQDLAPALNAGQEDLADPEVLCWGAIVLMDR